MRLKFYIINLLRSAHRRNSVINEMKKHNITNYTFVDGFDAINYELQNLQKLIDKKNVKRELPKGMIGCSVSHVKALRKFLSDDDAEVGVILEDDFEIKDNLGLTIGSISNTALDQGPVLLYAFVKEEMKLIKEDDLKGNHGLFAMEQPLDFLSTVGYCVNKNSAKKLLSKMYPLKDFPDGWKTYYEYGAFERLFVVYPFLLRHEVFESDRSENISLLGNIKKVISDFIVSTRFPFFYTIIKKYRSKWRDPEIDKIIFK